MSDELRAALAASAEQPVVSPAPVAAILRAGRFRRARRRGGLVAAAACALAVGVALPLTGPTTPAVGVYQAGVAASPGDQPLASQALVLTKAQVSGRTWSVLAVYYPSAPRGCTGLPGMTAPATPTRTPADGTHDATNSNVTNSGVTNSGANSGVSTGTPSFPLPTAGARKAVPPKLYAFAIGASSDGRTISHMFECEANPVGWNVGSGSYFGGVPLVATSGPQVFIGEPGASVAGATMTLSDGTKLTSPVHRLAGSGASVYAFVVPEHLQEKSLDEWDAHHHLVRHQNL